MQELAEMVPMTYSVVGKWKCLLSLSWSSKQGSFVSRFYGIAANELCDSAGGMFCAKVLL
jgi:hypothetical protein